MSKVFELSYIGVPTMSFLSIVDIQSPNILII